MRDAYDLVIRGGAIVDGTGAPSRPGDVAVRDGRIAAVGNLVQGAGAAAEIDASGLVVSPGFIDVHCHDDIALINIPGVEFKTAQGVATLVCGNCGLGAAPANEQFRQFYARGTEGVLGPVEEFTWRSHREFYDTVRAAKPSANAAFLAAHGTIRIAVMGLDRGPPSDEQMAVMKEHVREAMDAGAVGLSSGLIYVPGTFARTEELIELARVVEKYGGLYVSHIRNEGSGLLDAVAEAIHIGEEAGVPVQLSHHKASGEANFGLTEQSLPLIDEARARGVGVTMDAYPYVAASTALVAIARGGRLAPGLDPHDVLIASVKHQHEYEGKRVDEIASMMDLPVEDAVQRLLREEENTPVAVMFVMDEVDVRRVLQHPQCMIGSDGLPSPTGKPHPRLYGTFPRVLGRYVREEGLLSLEEGVRRMTSLPAQTFKLTDRGEVREGYWADLVVFDPAAIIDTGTYEDPRQYPRGISSVLVNGQLVVVDGSPRQVGAGQVLARG